MLTFLLHLYLLLPTYLLDLLIFPLVYKSRRSIEQNDSNVEMKFLNELINCFNLENN